MNRNFTIGIGFLIVFVIITLLVFLNVTDTIDSQTALAIYNASAGTLGTTILADFSKYGREYFWTIILLILLVTGSKQTKLFVLELATLFIVGMIFGELLKDLLYRPRPFLTMPSIVPRIPQDTDSSFPSGHALIVSIGALFSLVNMRNKILAILLTIEAAIVCYSRVYLGLHYPLDVLGAIMLGGAIVYLGVYVIDRYFSMYFQTFANLLVRILRDGPVNV